MCEIQELNRRSRLYGQFTDVLGIIITIILLLLLWLREIIMTSTQDVEALVTDSPISVVCVSQIIIFADLFFFLCFLTDCEGRICGRYTV